jgi:hypothetical protein
VTRPQSPVQITALGIIALPHSQERHARQHHEPARALEKSIEPGRTHPIPPAFSPTEFLRRLYRVSASATLRRNSYFWRIPPHEQPVSLPEKTNATKPSAEISIVVSRVSIDHSMPSGYSRLFCEGHITPGTGQDHLKGAECSIEFCEYDLEEDGRYPKEALPGGFSWFKGTRSFSVDLRYRKVDLTGPLASLIFAGTGDSVCIKMTLLADIAECKLGDLFGEISDWSVYRHRKLGNAKL